MIQWSRQTAHNQEVMGSNTGDVNWMDVSNATCYYIYIIKKSTEIKVAKWGAPKKCFFKYQNILIKYFDCKNINNLRSNCLTILNWIHIVDAVCGSCRSSNCCWKTCRDKQFEVMLCYVRLVQVRIGQKMWLGKVRIGKVKIGLGQARIGQVSLCYVM